MGANRWSVWREDGYSEDESFLLAAGSWIKHVSTGGAHQENDCTHYLVLKLRRFTKEMDR